MITKLGFVAGECFGQGEDYERDGDGNGEDWCGGIAPRPVHRSPKVHFCEELDQRPRHSYWTPPQRRSERTSRSHRSPQSAERARQVRIARRRNAS